MFKNYATTKFRSILLVSTFSLIVEYIVLLSHSLIVGQMLGAQALAALGIVTPFFSAIVFVAYMISMGTVVLSNIAVGRQDRDEANRYFSQAVILSVVAGIVLTLCMVLFKGAILSFFDVSPDILQYVDEYYRVFMFLPLVQMFFTLLYSIVINEGGEKICTVATIVQIVTNVGIAIVLCRTIGIAGCAVAFLVSSCLSALILCGHFFGKHNQLRFRWHLKPRSILEVLRLSSGESMSFLYTALFMIFMNALLARRFGDEAIVVFSVIINFQTLMITGLDGIGEAITPLVCVYHGEDNQHGIAKTMRTAVVFTLLESLTITALILLFAPFIPAAFGITEPHIVSATALALRIYSLSAIFWGLLMLMNSYYMYINKLLLCHIISALLLLINPILLCLAVPQSLGIAMNWAAMAVAAPLSMALCALFIKRKYRDRVFPFLLDKDGLGRQFSCDGLASLAGLKDIMAQAEDEMQHRGIGEAKRNEVLLMVEEVVMLSADNSGGKKFYVECTLFFGEEITLILRDGGTYTDGTEDAVPDSMEEFFRRSIVAGQESKKFVLTSGDNRTVFHFDYLPQNGGG